MWKTPTFRVLCAMARAEFTEAIDNFEWTERIKQRLVRQAWAYPAPQDLAAALEATARALAKEGRRRVDPAPASPTPPPEARPLSHDEAVAALRDVFARVGQRVAVRTIPRVPTFTPRQADSLIAIRQLRALVTDQAARVQVLERVAAAAVAEDLRDPLEPDE